MSRPGTVILQLLEGVNLHLLFGAIRQGTLGGPSHFTDDSGQDQSLASNVPEHLYGSFAVTGLLGVLGNVHQEADLLAGTPTIVPEGRLNHVGQEQRSKTAWFIFWGIWH